MGGDQVGRRAALGVCAAAVAPAWQLRGARVPRQVSSHVALVPSRSLKSIHRRRRSLRSLLESHTLVKVQLNGDARAVGQLAAHLEEQCGARLVDLRERTFLLAKGGARVAE